VKAIVRETYGPPDVLRLDDVPVPTNDDAGVLVRVHAASANAGDWHLLRGTPLPFRLIAGLHRPKFKIIGNDIAGTAEAVGRNVTQFKPGDEVFGEVSRCGFGAYAEYVVARESALAPKPAGLSFEEAASVPTSGCTALQGLRKGKIQSAKKVLIHVLDYAQVDFANSGQKFDRILAVNGDRSIWDYRRALTPTGRYVMSGGSNRQLLEALFLGPLLSIGGQKLGNLLARPNQSDLLVLKDLVEAGKVRPVIERC
jgi:NADPH:quinone reductase-like Zn-dependent oxidoreductase